MNHNEQNDRSNDIRLSLMHETALYAGIAAAMMLFFGFGRPFDIASGSQLYINSVFATNGLLRFGGMALALVALCCRIGLSWSLLADAIVSALIGAALIVIGGIWAANSDIDGFLFLIFGAMFLNAARNSWNSSARSPAIASASVPVVDREAPIARPIDEAARQSARERLLQTKANLRQQDALAPSVETQDMSPPAAAQTAEPILSEITKETLAASQARSSPSPAVASPSPEREPVSAPAPELPEEGFLAELGRANQNERK